MKDPLHFLETRRVSITSTVGVEAMPTAAAVDATVEDFPTHSLPKHSGNLDHNSTKETHQPLMEILASIECDLGGVQNSYLGLIPLPEQYACVS